MGYLHTPFKHNNDHSHNSSLLLFSNSKMTGACTLLSPPQLWTLYSDIRNRQIINVWTIAQCETWQQFTAKYETQMSMVFSGTRTKKWPQSHRLGGPSLRSIQLMPVASSSPGKKGRGGIITSCMSKSCSCNALTNRTLPQLGSFSLSDWLMRHG